MKNQNKSIFDLIILKKLENLTKTKSSNFLMNQY